MKSDPCRPGREGVNGSEAVHRVSRGLTQRPLSIAASSRSSPGHVNPSTQSFVNDPEADAMLTREYRAPFVLPAKV